MQPYVGYLQCEVMPGMFDREKAVQLYNKDGTPKASGFFPESNIKDGRLEVIVLDEREDEIFIEPIGAQSGQGFMFGPRNVWVSKSSVSVPVLTK